MILQDLNFNLFCLLEYQIEDEKRAYLFLHEKTLQNESITAI